VTRRVALILPFAFAAAWGAMPYAAAVPEARLTAITARVEASRDSLVIEASAPVPYITTRPDSLTILLDFRNVSGDKVAALPQPGVNSPIASVKLEAAESLGAPVSRVRISLARPVAHHVRSERNTVVVDLERGSVVTPAAMAANAMGAAPRQAGVNGPRIETPAVDPMAALGIGAGKSSAAALRPVTVTGTKQGALSASILQPPAAAGGQDTLPSGRGVQARTYSGTPISLDFQQADLRAVLRVFSEVSGLNIVIDPAVQGTVDVALRDVPWDQALDIILRANKLGYSIDGTIVRIAPLTVLSDEESQRLKLMQAQALAGELKVFTRALSYAKADDLMKLLKDTVLSQRGNVQIDPRTNTLIINDLPEFLTRASELITSLDVAQPQVEIEARIVETSRSFARQLGVEWGFMASARTDSGSLRGAAAGDAFGVPGNPAVSLPVPGAPSALAVALAGKVNLDLALSALESQGQGRILSTPRVSTQNNVEAEITQGIQIPIQTVANNTVTVTFKDAALTLKVTPQITAANTVIMQISVENASPDFSRQVNNIPPIDTQRANTRVQVNNGETTVIGGIYKSREQTNQDRTPGLHRVPLLGWLFKRDSVSDENRELLIFITPKISRL